LQSLPKPEKNFIIIYRFFQKIILITVLRRMLAESRKVLNIIKGHQRERAVAPPFITISI
jgi:hypothetical protein